MKLFIDANIYLRFYDSKAENYQKLLKTLQEVRKDIIVTYQIEDEIVRNRYRLFKDSLSQYNTKSQTELITIPVHISAKFNKDIDEWNKKRGKIQAEIKSSNKTLLKISNGALEEVYSATDVVSKTLNSLFKDALKPTAQQLNSAITRKTKGNPPGKITDPLGDQLNWEQLMGALRGVNKLFIVTQDKDYAVEIEKNSPVLHPLLLRDLKRKYPKIEVEVFYDLSSALKAFDREKNKPLKSLPDAEIMKKIEQEEQTIFDQASSVTVELISPAIHSHFCLACNKSTLHKHIRKTDAYGKFIDQKQMCSECGFIALVDEWVKV